MYLVNKFYHFIATDRQDTVANRIYTSVEYRSTND